MFTTRTTGKLATRAAFLTVTGGALLGASLTGAGAAQASQAQPERGFSSVESCTGVTGSITWSPGLVRNHTKKEHTVLTGTLSGCSGLNGAQAGTGTVTAVLNGRSSAGSIVQTGSITVNWPTSSGLNPSNGNVTLRRAASNQPYSLSGAFTSGAFTGAAVSTNVLVTAHHGTGSIAHPVTSQQYVNTAPLAARVNLG